jgi:hypothetical protein
MMLTDYRAMVYMAAKAARCIYYNLFINSHCKFNCNAKKHDNNELIVQKKLAIIDSSRDTNPVHIGEGFGFMI